jgi:hypothetical protein
MISTLGVKGLIEQGEIRSPQPPMFLVPCGNVHYLRQLFFRKILEEYPSKIYLKVF